VGYAHTDEASMKPLVYDDKLDEELDQFDAIANPRIYPAHSEDYLYDSTYLSYAQFVRDKYPDVWFRFMAWRATR
jgi:hypothetical protein